MASSRDLRREPGGQAGPPSTPRTKTAAGPGLQFAAQADHLDGRHGGLEALVAGLDAGAVERLLQGFAGEHAKAVGNAGLLLRLADAARHFVVDGLVVGGFAAQQAAQRHNGVHLAQVGQGARRRGNLPCAGNANHFNVGPLCAAAQQRVERAFQQPLGDHRIPAGDDDGKLHARGGEIAFDGHRLALDRIGPGPEAEGENPAPARR
jgi:hypothetical protein